MNRLPKFLLAMGLMFGTFVTGSPVAIAQAKEDPIEQLQKYLATATNDRPQLNDQSFASVALTKPQANRAIELLAADHLQSIRQTRSEEWKSRIIREGELSMPFDVKVFGEKPTTGRSLFISMHGGGGAPKRVNDQQWENQKRLYTPAEGVYIAPRAPTDTWNLWHQDHIDRMFTRLIADAIAFEEVDPDRVYIMGYSAGGDGVFQLAPRMADQLAAAAMMAGHPNETVPLGLRNLPFTLHMGGKDAAFNRNQIVRDWKVKLAELHAQDSKGYEHYVEIHEEKGHWMDREDAVAVDWMAKHTRQRSPSKVVWKQDDVTHTRFYWLGVPAQEAKGGSFIVASVDGQKIRIEKAEGVSSLELYLTDANLDLDQPIEVDFEGNLIAKTNASRTIASIQKTLIERDDPSVVCTAIVPVKWKP